MGNTLSTVLGHSIGYVMALLILNQISFSPQMMLSMIVTEYASRFSSQHLELPTLDLTRFYKDTEKMKVFQELVAFGQELEIFFRVPNQQIMSNVTITFNSNQVVAAFINFLLLMTEAFLFFENFSIVIPTDQIRNLQTELGFLVTFLGDTAMHLQLSNNIFIDIEALMNEVGSFIFSFFFTTVVRTQIVREEDNYVMVDVEAAVNEVLSFLRSNLIDSAGDTVLQTTKVEEIKNTTWDFKALVDNVKNLTDFFTLAENDHVPENGILNLALSNLLLKFEPLKIKIKEHCIAVSKIPSNMAPKTAVVSLFIVQSVLDDLRDLTNNKPDMIIGVDDQILELHEKLMLLGCSIMEFAEEQATDHEELVIRTRDVAYEVEYVINSFPHVWYINLRLPQLIEKIQLIMLASEKMKNKFGAVEKPKVAKCPDDQVSSQRKETPILEEYVVGFKEVKTEIVEQLVLGSDQLQVISIVGMPGLGKTTLANKVYNDTYVVYHFDKRSWCVVSQSYNKKNVLVEILSSMVDRKRETFLNMEEDDMVEILYKSLKGRRYLIMLDDIWGINVWNGLKICFPDDGVGSRILFTTRNKKVGWEASSHSNTNELPFLTDAECWELLHRKVFQNENCPQELLAIGKQIVKSCQGLPLSVVAIAGFLANMEKKEHLWKQVATDLSSHMSENLDNCIQILELSYNFLPMHLKPCFLYFGAFQEATDIPVRKLTNLWIAEGFIKKEEHKSLDDVALQYLMKLIDRSLVLVSRRGSDGGVKTCRIHHLLLDMCLRIAQKNNFLKLIKLNDDDPKGFFIQQHRCLSINYEDSMAYMPPFGLHVRSLLCANHMFPMVFSSSYKILRVLGIQESELSFVIGVENLVNLRYLGISRPLPPMESFHKLEFLVMCNSDAVEIRESLLNMMSLRHMHFIGGAYFSSSFREKVIKNVSFQISNNIESSSVLSISDETDEKILRCSPNLRRLKGRIGSSLHYSFDSFNQLESLKLSTDSTSTLISMPPNLKKFTLVQVHVSPEQMEIIGGLQYPEVLKLEKVAFKGGQWDIREGEFPQLKFLKLDDVQLAEWNASSDYFPRLQQLVLRSCKNLTMISSSLGYIATLLMIEVHECTKAVQKCAKKIQKEQVDMGNEVLKVIISSQQIDSDSEEESD